MTPKTVGKKMLAARQRSQFTGREPACRALSAQFPEQTIASKTLQRLEEGDPGAQAPARCSALCQVYGTTLREVLPEMADQLRAEAEELRRRSDLLILQSGYISAFPFHPSDHLTRVA